MVLATVMGMAPVRAPELAQALVPEPEQVPASAKAKRLVTVQSGRVRRCHKLPSRGRSPPGIPLRAKFLERESD